MSLCRNFLFLLMMKWDRDFSATPFFSFDVFFSGDGEIMIPHSFY